MKYSIDMKAKAPQADIRALESILEADQKAIRDFKAGLISGDDLTSINEGHAQAVRTFVSQYDFPTKSNASEKAYKAAVLVVLHSGDVSMLDASIAAISEASSDQVDRKDIAFMTDRRLVLQGKPQRYGTQYMVGPDGAIDFIEIEDRSGLDARREELGMGPFAQYERYVRGMLKK